MPPGYCDLQEALHILPVNDSTIERMVRDGRLRSARIARHGRKPQRVYLREDVERQAREKEARAAIRPRELEPRPKAKAPDALAAAMLGILENMQRQVRALEAPQPAPPPPAAPKTWLTIEEAQACGLSRKLLLTLCQTGQVICVRDGAWKILRKSLEAWEG